MPRQKRNLDPKPESLYQRILGFIDTNAFQQRFFSFLEKEDADLVFIWGERGCGKSFGMIMYLVMMSFKYGRAVDAFFTRKYKRALINSGVIEEAIDFVQGQTKSVSMESSGRDFSIEMITGGKITFCGVLNRSYVRRRFKGNHPSFLVIDEADETEEDTFKELLTCVRKKTAKGMSSDFKTKVVVLSNPKQGVWLRDYLDPYLNEKGFANQDMDGKKLYLYESENEHNERIKTFAETLEEVPEEQRDKALSIVSFYGKQEENSYWMSQNQQYKGFLSLGLHDDEICWGEKSFRHGDLIFHKEDFVMVSPETIKEKMGEDDSLIVISCDFASGSKRESSGMSSISVFGMCSKKDFYVLECNEGRYNMKESLKLIEDLSKKWKTRGLVIEQIQMGTPIIDELKSIGGYEIIAVSHRGELGQRFSLLRQRANAKRVYLSNKEASATKFIRQAIRYDEFTKAERKSKRIRDDILMSACHAINTLNIDQKYLLSKDILTGRISIEQDSNQEVYRNQDRPAKSRNYGFQFCGVA